MSTLNCLENCLTSTLLCPVLGILRCYTNSLSCLQEISPQKRKIEVGGRENKGRSFFFHTGENASREKVISIHFITYLWAEVVSLLNSTQNYNKSFVIHWETRFSFILIASGNTEQIQKQVFLVCLFVFNRNSASVACFMC